jgi:hypothetical protein
MADILGNFVLPEVDVLAGVAGHNMAIRKCHVQSVLNFRKWESNK